MIASVRGTLLELGEGFVVVEAGGMGYQVHVTTATLVSLPAVGEEVRLHTRHVVREDAQLLFGFAERDEYVAVSFNFFEEFRPHDCAPSLREGRSMFGSL